MSKYLKVGSGNAFKNKNSENRPPYSGNKFKLEIDGKTHELNIAIWDNNKTSNGNEYLSVSLTKIVEE
tara:strand:- start:30 stop:233 length:204 start_codon:yes stop_codon:yes gene_type:complete